MKKKQCRADSLVLEKDSSPPRSLIQAITIIISKRLIVGQELGHVETLVESGEIGQLNLFIISQDPEGIGIHTETHNSGVYTDSN